MTLHRCQAAVLSLGMALSMTLTPVTALTQGVGAAGHCPPGLAKKSPACVPPGQAKAAVRVGDVLKLGGIHVVTRPGLYGLGVPPSGDQYAVVGNHLLRVDGETGKVLSILRTVTAILD